MTILGRFGITVAFLASTAVTTIIVLSLGTVIYPGSLRWTAPVLCPDDQPDAFVVRTTTSDSEGTSTNFSLFCMGDRGDFTEAGSWRPLGLLFLYTYLAALALVTVLAMLLFRRRRRRRENERAERAPRSLAPL